MTDYLTAQWLSCKEDGAAVGARSNDYSNMVSGVPCQYRRIINDEAILISGRSWQVMMGFGHAPEHASLFCKELGILISGDMLLPRISTNVSVYDADPDADPLGLYLDSIEKYLALPEDTLVLPSHGKPCPGMRIRIAQLKTHHDERLIDTLGACNKPAQSLEHVPVCSGVN